MTVACLALLTLIGLGEPPPDVTELVVRLGSVRSAEREAAAGALERMGRAALPALRGARDSRDLKVRARAAALLDAIEGRQLISATLVPLDFRDRPVAEVVETIGKRCGMVLMLVSDGAPKLPPRPITLEAPDSVPFWTALDRLCQAGGLRVVPPSETWQFRRQVMPNGMGGPQRRRTTGTELLLVPQDGRGIGPVSDFGAFRIVLTTLHHQRDRVFFRDAPAPSGSTSESERFLARVQVMVEPRLTLAWDGKPVLSEAIDDQGQSLVPERNPKLLRESGPVLEFGSRPDLLDIPMTYPERPGKTIMRLRGMLPAVVSGRRPDPLVVPLGEALGKMFHSEEAALTIHQVKTVPNQPGVAVDLTLTLPEVARTMFGSPLPSDLRRGLRPPPPPQPQLEFVDAWGRVCQAFALGPARLGDGMRRTLQITPAEGAGPPVGVRYYGSTWRKIEVPFEFRDLPLP